MASYGQRIRAARAWKGWSQRELGEALGIDEQTVKRREADKQQPKDGELIAIAQVCGVPLEFLQNGFARSIAGGSDDKLDAILSQLQELRAYLLADVVSRPEISPTDAAEALARQLLAAAEAARTARELEQPDEGEQGHPGR